MLGADPEIGSAAFRLWVAAASAALFAVLLVLAFVVPRASTARTVAALRACLVTLGAMLGAAMTWAFLAGAATGDHGAERRALKLRAAELIAQTLAPSSTLACLDALVGDSLAAACEKAVFASPVSVASAMSYVAARLALLADAAAYGGRRGGAIDDMLLSLRRSLEVDRFGLLAHVLAMRDGCTSQNCNALALLRDPSRVRANLGARTLDRHLEYYLAVWAKGSDSSPAEATQSQPIAQGPRKVNIDFPSAASIPPVSIVNAEPTGPVLPGVAAAAAANPNPQPAAPSSTRRPHRQPASPAQSTAPAAVATPAAVDPIWPEPVPPPPAQSAPGPGATAPVQLTPTAPAPQASASLPTRSP